MPRKNFVLDTNVLLHDPKAIFGFDDNTICIPIVVIEEMDTFKKNPTELGRNAREVSRELDRLRRSGCLSTGVPIPGGGLVRVLISNRELPHHLRISHQADNRIMATALHIKESEPETPTIFVTLDTNLRIRANALGIESVDYDADNVTMEGLYTGATDITCEPALLDDIFEHGEAELPELASNEFVYENEYVTIRDDRRSALALIRVEANKLVLARPFRDSVWGIHPRNREQHFALDACLREDITVVTLVGKAGTGKTLLALAAGLSQVTDIDRYNRLLVSRPIMPMGKDIGFLPGDVEDKLKPWMMPIHDNLEFLLGLGQTGHERRAQKAVSDLVGMGVLEIEPLTYIRGRSIPNQYLIVDEAQNLTPHEVKTILTRAGEGTKVVFAGDPYQIDNPYVDSTSNGLTHLVEHFKGASIAATVSLMKGERSPLAELAANLL